MPDRRYLLFLASFLRLQQESRDQKYRRSVTSMAKGRSSPPPAFSPACYQESGSAPGPRSIPLLKDVARCASAVDASRMARAALSLSTPDDVAALLAREAETLLSGDPETREAVIP